MWNLVKKWYKLIYKTDSQILKFTVAKREMLDEMIN